MAVLVKEESSRQSPINYISKELQATENNYPTIEKMDFTLIIASRKLMHYFFSHPIRVRTQFPLSTTLGKAETSGRMLKWAIELTEYHILYEPRVAIKGQVLADFVAEFQATEFEIPTTIANSPTWQIWIDGSST